MDYDIVRNEQFMQCFRVSTILDLDTMVLDEHVAPEVERAIATGPEDIAVEISKRFPELKEATTTDALITGIIARAETDKLGFLVRCDRPVFKRDPNHLSRLLYSWDDPVKKWFYGDIYAMAWGKAQVWASLWKARAEADLEPGIVEIGVLPSKR